MRVWPIGILVLIAFNLSAQAPNAAPAASAPASPMGPVVVSPEVSSDHHVTFRLYAPHAQEVTVRFDGKGGALSKREDGVWEGTFGPLDAGAYRYGFTVDGANVTDPRDIEMERMQVMARSILYVPGSDFMELRDVPHGAVAVVNYYSTVLKKFRRFHIYTPPGYEANQQIYPVLYLLHGANESDDSWSTVGRMNFILDNLISSGKAAPMIVVMPNGHIDQTPPRLGPPATAGGPPPLRGEFAQFPAEFTTDIQPYVESHYRTLNDRSHRAIAGLSMGGTQTLNIAFANLKAFSAIGVFSSGILGGNVSDWEKDHLSVLDDASLKKGLKVVWFSTGSDDSLIGTSKSTVAMLNKHNFGATFQESTGAHTWVNWRQYLYEFAPQIFR